MLNLRNTFSLIADNQSQRFPPPPPPPLSLSLIPPIPTKPIAFIVIDLKLSRWSKYVKEKVIICWNFSRDYCHPKTMTHTHKQSKVRAAASSLLCMRPLLPQIGLKTEMQLMPLKKIYTLVATCFVINLSIFSLTEFLLGFSFCLIITLFI